MASETMERLADLLGEHAVHASGRHCDCVTNFECTTHQDRLRDEILALVATARREGAAAMRERCAKRMCFACAKGWPFQDGSRETRHLHLGGKPGDTIECESHYIREIPLPGAEP